jgi:predicted transcriptional regulator
MSKLAIIAIVGMLALAATADIAALEWSIGFQKSIQALISLALLGASMIVIVSEKSADKDRNWAYGTVGALIGFWLHVT